MFRPPKKVQKSCPNAAYLYLVRLLSKRDYSEHKLREKLKLRGFDQKHIDESIQEVLDLGYLREENYINAKVRGLMLKGHSPTNIKYKLAQEKITINTDEILSIFTENHYSIEDQINNLLQKKIKEDLRNLSKEEFYKQKQKILTYVMGRGHSLDQIIRLFEQYLSETYQ